MRSDDWKDLLGQSIEYLDSRQEWCKREFRLSEYERYFWDQENGTIVFSDEGIPKVEATIQFVGTFSSNSDTWLWGWANESFLDDLTSDVLSVREFGRKHGFSQLTEEGCARRQISLCGDDN